ncbi:MAG: TIGR02186 family protein [Nitrospiraceae bacterium]|nr:TIGR02186 family protein [Nitrospiraceae bacterium]
MRKKTIYLKALHLFALLLAGGFWAMPDDARALSVKANHDNIKVGFFYHGSTVKVSGAAGAGSGVVIKITAPEGHQVLRKKGKAAGVLWMNTGSLSFERVPDLYFIRSTAKPESILTPQELEANVIGYGALGRHMEIKPCADEQEKARWFSELVKYKENTRLFSPSGGITVADPSGKREFSTEINWPYQAPSGEYTVTAYEVRDGKVIARSQAKITVEHVGAVKLFADMAKKNAALYGLISLVVAVGAGFGVGMIFGKGGGAH